MPLVRAPVPKTSVQPCQLVLGPWMELFSLVPTLQSGSKTYESASFRLCWSFYLVTTNVGIPGTLVVRGWQLGIAISFCAVVLKLRCVHLIAQIETIRRQTSLFAQIRNTII